MSQAFNSFSIGWDVGGWNCDKNSKSRDAIVILDSELGIVGKPWRGTLRECIAGSITTDDWLEALFEKCNSPYPGKSPRITMAIDTPLGYSQEFVCLVNRRGRVEPDKTFGLNRYLFRHTERLLYERDLRPLSAVNDMIGSQATKGMHVLAKFAQQIESCGVWSDGNSFRAIETYPTACRNTKAVEALKSGISHGNDDENDAHICALVAHLFAFNPDCLEGPEDTVPPNEGWIWVPKRACTG